jgi:hypothetical protein
VVPPLRGACLVTLEEVAALAKGIDANGRRLMVNAARHAGWTPEEMAEMWVRCCAMGGRDPVVLLVEVAYDL